MFTVFQLWYQFLDKHDCKTEYKYFQQWQCHNKYRNGKGWELGFGVRESRKIGIGRLAFHKMEPRDSVYCL